MFLRPFHPAAKLHGHKLGAVANPQDRYIKFQNLWVSLWGIIGIDTCRAAGEHDSLWRHFLDFVNRDIKGMNLAIDLLFAYTTGNKLRCL